MLAAATPGVAVTSSSAIVGPSSCCLEEVLALKRASGQDEAQLDGIMARSVGTRLETSHLTIG